MADVRIRSPLAADPEAATAVSDEVDPIAATAVSGSEPAAAPRPDPLVGRQLRHFRVESRLGRGGMGAVYRAWDGSLERPVALKVLHRESAETRARFMREARAQAQIRHPNVVPIHFVGEDDGIAFLVMDLVEGESLSDVLDREGRLPVERGLDIVEAVARALEAGLERGLVHRDVKPSNILLDRRGHVLLADFGLAKQVAAADEPPVEASSGPAVSGLALTRAGTLVGTPAYAAPEQATGAPVDHRADVYAIGITLYEAVCGQLPFTAPTVPELVEQHRSEPPLPPRVVVPELPGPVEALVLRMLQKDPDRRFATYADLRDAVAAARARPRVGASVFVRGIAALCDIVLAALPVGLLALLVWEPLGTPLIAAALGLVEGRWSTTPGKRLLRLRVVGPDGGAIGYRRAMVRSFLKLWGSIAVGIAGPLLPDAAWVFAIKCVVLGAWALGFAMALFGKKLALHDRVAGTRVVYAI